MTGFRRWCNTGITLQEHVFIQIRFTPKPLWYQLVLAIAQPHRAIFLECHRCMPILPAIRFGDYNYAGFRFVDHSSVPWVGKHDIMVCPDSFFRDGHVHTVGWAVPWVVSTRFLRRPGSSSSTSQVSRPRSRGPTDPEVLRFLQLDFPWLSLEEFELMLSSKVSVAGGGFWLVFFRQRFYCGYFRAR